MLPSAVSAMALFLPTHLSSFAITVITRFNPNGYKWAEIYDAMWHHTSLSSISIMIYWSARLDCSSFSHLTQQLLFNKIFKDQEYEKKRNKNIGNHWLIYYIIHIPFVAPVRHRKLYNFYRVDDKCESIPVFQRNSGWNCEWNGMPEQDNVIVA